MDIPGRMDTIRTFRAAGGLIAAVTPIHDPRALLRSHGVLPVEVWGPPRTDTAAGDARLQAYTCSIVRCALAFFQEGGLDPVDLLVMPHACDSLQGLASVMQKFVAPARPVLPLYLPRGRRGCDVAFLAEELRALGAAVGGVTGRTPAEDELFAAIRREEASDAACRRLLEERLPVEGDFPSLYRLLRAREYLPAEDWTALAEGMPPPAEPRGVPLILSGVVPEPMGILDALREAGARLVADDTACIGRRAYFPGSSTDPWMRMAEAVVHGPPDPMRGSPVRERARRLLDLAAATGARGVLFLPVKSCEPELFDLPLLTKALRGEGLQTLVVETEVGPPLAQQAMGRLEAFVEMLS